MKPSIVIEGEYAGAVVSWEVVDDSDYDETFEVRLTFDDPALNPPDFIKPYWVVTQIRLDYKPPRDFQRLAKAGQKFYEFLMQFVRRVNESTQI